MRTKEEEKRNISTKRKKQNKKNNQVYEQINKSNHLGGISFTVNNETDRLIKWKKLFYIRYFMHLGSKENINVGYKSIKSSDNDDIEERYKIVTTGKERLSLSITIYHSTGRILIQGNSRKEWLENEFQKMKRIIDNIEAEQDVESEYLKVYGIKDPICDESDNENFIIDEVVNKLVNDVVNKVVTEPKGEISNVEISPIGKNNKTKTKLSTKNLDEKKNKVYQIQIKNNKNAIENLETMFIEMQENYEKRLQELDKNIVEMNKGHLKEMSQMKNENKLAVQFAKEQIITISKLEEEGLRKEKEILIEIQNKDEQLNKLQEKVKDMEVVVKQNIKIVEKGYKNQILELEEKIADNKEKIINTSRRDITENMKERLKIVERKIETDKKEKEVNYDNKLINLKRDKEDKDESGRQKRKREIKDEVIIIMDSNRRYINKDRFWNGHTCKIIQAGDVITARKVLKENDFKEAKFIFLHVGTNDIEKIECVDNVANQIIELGKLAKKLNPDTNIMVSEIPIRGDYLNENRMAVNEFMKKAMPESINLVKHQNLTKEMLVDKKHFKENKIHNIVRNMKDALRQILKPNHSTVHMKSINSVHEEKVYHNVNEEGKKNLNFNVMDMKKKISALVEYLVKF